jgi:hypothetical protein
MQLGGRGHIRFSPERDTSVDYESPPHTIPVSHAHGSGNDVDGWFSEHEPYDILNQHAGSADIKWSEEAAPEANGLVISDVGHCEDAPFIDSGYASVPLESCKPAAPEDKDKCDSDSKTIVSAATTVIPSVAEETIAEVCSDIQKQVQGHIDEDNRQVLLDALPNLVKALALRLASLDSKDAHRGIMHFVYSRHA